MAEYKTLSGADLLVQKYGKTENLIRLSTQSVSNNPRHGAERSQSNGNRVCRARDVVSRLHIQDMSQSGYANYSTMEKTCSVQIDSYIWWVAS